MVIFDKVSSPRNIMIYKNLVVSRHFCNVHYNELFSVANRRWHNGNKLSM